MGSGPPERLPSFQLRLLWVSCVRYVYQSTLLYGYRDREREREREKRARERERARERQPDRVQRILLRYRCSICSQAKLTTSEALLHCHLLAYKNSKNNTHNKSCNSTKTTVMIIAITRNAMSPRPSQGVALPASTKVIRLCQKHAGRNLQ